MAAEDDRKDEFFIICLRNTTDLINIFLSFSLNHVIQRNVIVRAQLDNGSCLTVKPPSTMVQWDCFAESTDCGTSFTEDGMAMHGATLLRLVVVELLTPANICW